MQKKFLSKILISVIVLGVLMAPISPVFQARNEYNKNIAIINIQKNEAEAKEQESFLEGKLDACLSIGKGTVKGCFQQLLYFIAVTIPSFLLVLVAKFFNFTAALTLSDDMYRADFIEKISDPATRSPDSHHQKEL